MKPVVIVLATLALVSTPALAQKVTIDYAADFDFESVASYQIVGATDGATSDQLVYDRIKHGVIRELHRGGLNTAYTDPDLYVVFYVTPSDAPVPIDALPHGGATGEGWRRWKGDPAPPVLDAGEIREGTLVVDAWTASNPRLIWRATGVIKPGAKPKKQFKRINNVLTELGQRWRKILAGEAR